MKTLEEGQKKIQQLCDLLKKDAVEPAKKEAESILEEARIQAQEMISEAEQQIHKLREEARKAIEQDENVFRSFMAQAAKQTLESLRQEIEKKFFKNELHSQISQQASEPKVIAKLLEVVVTAIEKDGISADLSAIVPHSVSVKEVNAFLLDNIIGKLREKSVVLGNFAGGVQVKLHDKQMVLDISDEALVDLLNGYRKGFRDLLFQK
jgi:V/A-type H+-transporting ATPase subunit E